MLQVIVTTWATVAGEVTRNGVPEASASEQVELFFCSHPLGRPTALNWEHRPIARKACGKVNSQLTFDFHIADVAELADALDSGSSGRKVVEVQVLSSALFSSCPFLGQRNSGATKLPKMRYVAVPFGLWRTGPIQVLGICGDAKAICYAFSYRHYPANEIGHRP